MTTITNPIINSAFREPTRHFRFDEDGITAEIEDGRRLSTYFVPIPRPKKKGGQLSLGIQDGWGNERMKANDFINDVRRYVAVFRASDYPGITATTRELLRYWRYPAASTRLGPSRMPWTARYRIGSCTRPSPAGWAARSRRGRVTSSWVCVVMFMTLILAQNATDPLHE